VFYVIVLLIFVCTATVLSSCMTMSLLPHILLQDPTGKVRGKVASDSKPRTFNQLWTSEEQVCTILKPVNPVYGYMC